MSGQADYEIRTKLTIDDRTSATGAAAVIKQIQAVEAEAAKAGKQISGLFGKAFGAGRGLKARITVDHTAAAPGVAAVNEQIKGIERQAESTSSRISGFLGRAFAVAGGIYGAKQLAGSITGIHTEVQNAEGSLATLFSALEGMDIGDALPFAREQVRLLNEDAAKGVGGLEDYQNAFTRLVAPARAAGASFEEIRRLTKLGITAGFALGGSTGAQQLPMDIVQSLTGGAGEIITKNLNIALGAIGMTTTEFNKLDKAAKLVALEEALSGFAAGAALMGQGWEAQTETLNDAVKRIARTLTAPLFERWTESLRTANDWLEKNADWIDTIAEDLSGSVVKAWDQVISKAGTYAAILGGIALADSLPSLPGGSGRSRVGAKGGGGLNKAIGDAIGTTLKGGVFGRAGGAARGGGIRMPSQGLFASMFGRKGGAGIGGGIRLPSQGKLGGGGGQGLMEALFGRKGGGGLGGGIQMPTQGAIGMGGSAAVLSQIATSIAAIAGPAILVTGLLVGVAGALEEWPALWGMLVDLGAQLSISFGMVMEAFGGLTAQGSLLNILGGALIGVLYGVGMAFNVVVRAAALVIEAIGFLSLALGSMAKMAFATVNMMAAAMSGDVKGVQSASANYRSAREAGRKGMDDSVVRMKKILGLVPDAGKAGAAEGAAAGGPPGGLGPSPNVAGNVTNIGTVNVDARSEINNDPARIAVGWSKMMTGIQRNPLSTKRSASPLLG